MLKLHYRNLQRCNLLSRWPRRMTGGAAARAAAGRHQGDRRRPTASTPCRSRRSRARRASRARSSTGTSRISAACWRRWWSARRGARSSPAPGDLRRPAGRARPPTSMRCGRDPDTWRLVLMPPGGRAAAAARADRGRPRRGDRAPGECRARTSCPTRSSPRTCCRRTRTRPPGSCYWRITTWSASSGSPAGPWHARRA